MDESLRKGSHLVTIPLLQVTVSFENDKTTFTRMGSFRQMTLTEKMADPQSAVVTETVPVTPKPGQFKLARIASTLCDIMP